MIAGVSMASGLLIGGFGVDWAGRFDRRWYVWGPALGLLLATPLFILGFTRENLSAAVIILIFSHVSMFVFYSPTWRWRRTWSAPTCARPLPSWCRAW